MFESQQTPEQRIESIRRGLEAVYPGEWWYEYKRTRARLHMGHPRYGRIEMEMGGDLNLATGTFIAHAREDVPFLLEQIDRLTQERDHARRRWHETEAELQYALGNTTGVNPK